MTSTTAIVAIALGLTPVRPGLEVQTFRYGANDYAPMSHNYHRAVDRRGVTHVSGTYRGTSFALAVRANGAVEGNVGDYFVTFTARDAD